MLLCHSGKLQCCSHYRSRLWLTACKPHEVTAALMLRYVCDKALILLIHAPSCQAWTDATPKALFSTSSRQRRSDRTPFFYSLAARGSGSRRTGFFVFHVVTASSELDFHEPLQFIRYVQESLIARSLRDPRSTGDHICRPDVPHSWCSDAGVADLHLAGFE